MGAQDGDGVQAVTEASAENRPPNHDEIEVTLLGPGYGESVVVHIGDGAWVIVDSCINQDGTPQALEYLERIGVNPVQAVNLIVATHWHDDHIRGMADIVEVCENARFCCAGALGEMEFLQAIRGLEGQHFSGSGSGVREIHRVFGQFEDSDNQPTFALANRRLYGRDTCEIWTLSPHDSEFVNFLRRMKTLTPKAGETKRRIPAISPNDIAVVLWIRVDDVVVLLGSDLERQGWKAILKSEGRPTREASLYKVAHHGSAGADTSEVWKLMLEREPFAALTPWRRGGRALPTREDVRRILTQTDNAFATWWPENVPRARKRKHPAVARTLRGSGISMRGSVPESGAVRLRRPVNAEKQWRAENFGRACHLKELLA